MNPTPKPWWAGDNRVEKYMPPVKEAISRHLPRGDAATDIYNRAYEAIYEAIIDTENNKIVSTELIKIAPLLKKGRD